LKVFLKRIHLFRLICPLTAYKKKKHVFLSVFFFFLALVVVVVVCLGGFDKVIGTGSLKKKECVVGRCEDELDKVKDMGR
jgi:hypothetical protein